MLFHILRRVQETAPEVPVAIVVGHGREKVESAVRADPDFAKMEITFVHQAEQRGTGHAARCAMDSPWGEARVKEKAEVLILPGDLPLIPAKLVEQLLAPLGKNEALRLLTTVLADPTGYGRVVRRGTRGPVLKIVEEKDANLRQKQICEVAVSIYTFQAVFLRYGLQRLSNKNAQGEYYLTDLIAQAASAKKKAEVLVWDGPQDLRGINDPWELAQARRILNQTLWRNGLSRASRSWIRIRPGSMPWCQLEREVTVHPGAIFKGARESPREPRSVRTSCSRTSKSVRAPTSRPGPWPRARRSVLASQIGPYAHLQAGVGRGGGRQDRQFRGAQEDLRRRAHEHRASLLSGRRDRGQACQYRLRFCDLQFRRPGDRRQPQASHDHRRRRFHGKRLPDHRAGQESGGELMSLRARP